MAKGRHDKDDWIRLGQALIRRRVQMDPAYRNLSRFARERGMEYRVLWDLEKGARDNYQNTTLIAAEVAYAVKFGSIRAVLDGGELTADGFTPRERAVLEEAPEAFRRLAEERNQAARPQRGDRAAGED